jgi:hypothetical protein
MNIEITKDKLIPGDVFYEKVDPSLIWQWYGSYAYGPDDILVEVDIIDDPVVVVYNTQGNRADNQAVAPRVPAKRTKINGRYTNLMVGGKRMSLEQRVRAMRREARNSFYRERAEGYGYYPGVTNWRMIIARQFKIPISRVREILGEDNK